MSDVIRFAYNFIIRLDAVGGFMFEFKLLHFIIMSLRDAAPFLYFLLIYYVILLNHLRSSRTLQTVYKCQFMDINVSLKEIVTGYILFLFNFNTVELIYLLTRIISKR